MFNWLFQSAPQATDGLTQAQREAMVDLLNYCMFADNRVALGENQFIASKVKSLNWDPKISFDSYQGKSIGSARAALDNPGSKQHFFASISQRLGTAELRQRAVDLSQRLFVADGTKSAKESALQNEIRQALHLAQ